MLKKLMAWNKRTGEKWANGVTGGQSMREKWSDIKTETREGVEQDKAHRDAKLAKIAHIHQDDNELASEYIRAQEAINQDPNLNARQRMVARGELAKNHRQAMQAAHATRKEEVNG